MCVCVLVCVCVPDGVVEGEVLLAELWLRAQRQVDLQETVLHPLGGQLTLRLGQHGRERDSLSHGLLVVAAQQQQQQQGNQAASKTRCKPPEITAAKKHERKDFSIKVIQLVLHECYLSLR